jgi:hypothetical protein
MSIELTVLTVMALLLLALALVYSIGFTFQFGLKTMLGNGRALAPLLAGQTDAAGLTSISWRICSRSQSWCCAQEPSAFRIL